MVPRSNNDREMGCEPPHPHCPADANFTDPTIFAVVAKKNRAKKCREEILSFRTSGPGFASQNGDCRVENDLGSGAPLMAIDPNPGPITWTRSRIAPVTLPPRFGSNS